MTVVWTTAFVDLPAPVHGRGTAFWRAVTASDVSSPRGEDGRFTTLLPGDGDPFVRLQRLGDVPRYHLDLHVDDVTAEVARAVGLGARVVLREVHAVLASPGGLVHCLVPDAGERHRPAPVHGPAGGTSCVDQACLDVPAPLLAAEVAYWSALTGWPARTGSRPEFTVLHRPPGMPLRLMLQELGPQDPRTEVAVHLDVACGAGVDAVTAEHLELGAGVVSPRAPDRGQPWTVLADPAGLLYCLTPRDPWTGLVV